MPPYLSKGIGSKNCQQCKSRGKGGRPNGRKRCGGQSFTSTAKEREGRTLSRQKDSVLHFTKLTELKSCIWTCLFYFWGVRKKSEQLGFIWPQTLDQCSLPTALVFAFPFPHFFLLHPHRLPHPYLSYACWSPCLARNLWKEQVSLQHLWAPMYMRPSSTTGSAHGSVLTHCSPLKAQLQLDTFPQ